MTPAIWIEHPFPEQLELGVHVVPAALWTVDDELFELFVVDLVVNVVLAWSICWLEMTAVCRFVRTSDFVAESAFVRFAFATVVRLIC